LWPTTERLVVARIAGAKGLSGGLRVEVLTDWPEHLDVGSILYLEGEELQRRVERAEWGGRTLVLGLEGVGDRGAAEALAGSYLEIDAGPPPEGSYYWHQLEGLAVRDERGRDLGRLTEVFRAGDAEVYRVVGDGGAETLLPAIRQVVLHIDLDRGEMIVRYEPEEVS
jgi:16S rRNA processing protein RimM